MTSPEKPIFVHSVAGSVTPLVTNGSNPTFMSLDLDTETLLPITKATHYFDLEKANTEGTPTWVSADYLESYALADLSPSTMMDFANRVKTDASTAALWEWNVLGRSFELPTEPKD